jgi:uncharacterized membrane protein YcaP (DUF421 family)
MAELSVPLVHGVVPILTLLIVHFLICFIARKSMIARYLLSGKPAIVISPKGINYTELKALNMTLDDLFELMRGCDVFNVEDVSYAILETNGKLCIMKKAETEPASREDLKVKVSQNSIPISVIMDGKIMEDNLATVEIDRAFLDIYIKKANLEKVSDVLLMNIDKNGKIFIQGKYSKEYFSFQSDYNGGDKW